MCKIMAIAGITEKTKGHAWEWAYASAPFMMEMGNRDGFGYACQTEDGNLYGERWLNPEDVFKGGTELSAAEQEVQAMFLGALESHAANYNSFGDEFRDKSPVSMMLHSRLATTPKGLSNTHPFIRDNIALIHNGQIRNLSELELRTSTCDSEAILNNYIDNDVQKHPKNIEELSRDLLGYYGCAVMGNDADGPYVDVFKDTGAQLCVARIKELDTLVFCTTASVIADTAKKLNWTVEYYLAVRPGYLMRLDSATGLVRSITPFDVHARFGTGGGAPATTTATTSKYPKVVHTPASTAIVTSHHAADDDEDITQDMIKKMLEAEHSRQEYKSDRDNPLSPYYVQNGH